MMGISRATYYYKKKECTKKISDFDLKVMIEEVQKELPGYGYRRLYEHFLRQGVRINSKRIRRVMKVYNLHSCLKKWMKPRGSNTAIDLRYPNLIKGLELNASNQVWATDITFIRLRNQFVYLSAVIDIYTRKIVGWSLSRSLVHDFCIKAMEVAIKNENPPRGVIHHSDRGVQYVCEPYVRFLKKNGFEISMSAVGTPKENAFIETFFKTLKYEEIYFKNYQNIRDVIKHLPRFIEEVYNKKRLHSSLGYQSPEEFERNTMKLETASRPTQKIWGKAV
jgi:putative transposase